MNRSSKNQRPEWEQSYVRRENYLFWPNEEVIRFVSRHVRQRIGVHEFREIAPVGRRRLLDLGCGVGRHVIFAFEMGFDAYGVDHSATAVSEAVKWAAEKGMPEAREHIVQSDLRGLPWPDGYFDYAVSHGVLDSMHFENARAAIEELARVLVPEAMFYCDLIAGQDSTHPNGFAGEEVVSSRHEKGTVQSYFDEEKIGRLIHPHFSLVEGCLIRRTHLPTESYKSRYHLILRRR